MTFPPLAIIGTGRMGTAVAEHAAAIGWKPVAIIASADNPGGSGITTKTLSGAEVAIEFTTPAAAPDVVRALLAVRCAVVSGSTGWADDLEAVSQDVRASGGALLHSPNFSLGAAVFTLLVERAAELLAQHAAFDPHIVETHHAAKVDAPSGTALALARAMEPRLDRPVPISSIRVGAVPGTHQVILDAAFEQLRLEHDVRDRRVFAEGALAAARWLAGRSGVFGMRDLLSREVAR